MSIQQMFLGAGGGKAYTEATGGTITTSGDWKIHTFTSSGTFTVTKVGETDTIEYLIVGGGGCGGGSYTTQGGSGGGGGAGGFITSVVGATSGRINSTGSTAAWTAPVITASNYTITVGAGGTNWYGGDSIIAGMLDGSSTSLTGLGGGYGYGLYGNGGSGGSGGGSGIRCDQSGYVNSTGHQGYRGSCAGYMYSEGGGGGGAGGAANNDLGASRGSNHIGGPGLSSSITGTAVTYAEGGSGIWTQPTAKAANTGDGGDGAGSTSHVGGYGGSGIVIIRYKYQN